VQLTLYTLNLMCSFYRCFIWFLCQSSLATTEQCNQKLVLINHTANYHKNSTSNLKLKDFEQHDYLSSICWKQVNQLKISNSALSELETNALPEHLESLYLSNNKISDIHPNAFNKLQQLVDLDLSDNHIRQLNQFTFYKLDNLEELSLKNNQLTDIKINFQARSPKLHTLELDVNDLKYFDVQNIRKWDGTVLNQKKNYEMFSLKKLDLSSNPNLKLTPNSFLNSNEMTHLYLHGISAMPSFEELFLSLGNLEDLSIGHSELQQFNCSHFPTLLKLKTLSIKGERISQIYCSNLKTKMPGLSEIYATKNMMDPKTLKNLNTTLYANGIVLMGGILDNNENFSIKQSQIVSMPLVYVIFLSFGILFVCILGLLYFLLKKPLSSTSPGSQNNIPQGPLAQEQNSGLQAQTIAKNNLK
jgi:Leucine-rich repeat (LRR) protein